MKLYLLRNNVKYFFILVFLTLGIFTSKAQNKIYFGSILIQNGVYCVRLKNSDLYWNASEENIKLNLINKSSNILFVPAGRGYYYIKFMSNEKYLSVISEDNNLVLKTTVLYKQKKQQFKIIEACNAGFRFIAFNGFLLGYNNNKLILEKGDKPDACFFEIVKSATMTKIGGY